MKACLLRTQDWLVLLQGAHKLPAPVYFDRSEGNEAFAPTTPVSVGLSRAWLKHSQPNNQMADGIYHVLVHVSHA